MGFHCTYFSLLYTILLFIAKKVNQSLLHVHVLLCASSETGSHQ